MSGTPRHPFESLLLQLTGCMSKEGATFRHGFGTQEDSEHTSVDRCVWIPGDIDVIDLPYQMPDADTPSGQACTFDVSIYAGSPLQVYSRHEELAGYLDLIVGPPQGAPASQDGSRPHKPGYRIHKSRVAPRGGDGASSGWGTIVPVTLFKPLESVRLVSRDIDEATLTAGTTDIDGTGEETAVQTT